MRGKRFGQLVIGAILMGAVACAPPRPRQRVYVVQTAPPPDLVETQTPQPGPEYVWVSGYNRWDDSSGQYVWMQGHWAVPPQGYHAWVSGHWTQHGGGWVWIEGHWR